MFIFLSSGQEKAKGMMILRSTADSILDDFFGNAFSASFLMKMGEYIGVAGETGAVLIQDRRAEFWKVC